MFLFKRHSAEYRIVAKSKYFDKKWYKNNYLNHDDKNTNPVDHYLNIGWRRMYNPSAKFDTQTYLDKNLDVKFAFQNPLVHYETRGKKEGRAVYPVKTI